MANEKILVADDNPIIVEVIKSALKAENYQVSVAYDGQEALDKVHQENPDLILLDILMPKMNGYMVCKKIKDDPKVKHIPIIMLTAKEQESDKDKGLGMGADEYLTKPFEMEKLIEIIKKKIG